MFSYVFLTCRLKLSDKTITILRRIVLRRIKEIFLK